MSKFKLNKKVVKSWKFWLFLYLTLGVFLGFIVPLINDKTLGESLKDNIVITIAYPIYFFHGKSLPKGLAVGDIKLLSGADFIKTQYIEIPKFAYISCEPAPGGDQRKEFTFGAERKNFKCNDGIGMNDGCTIKFIPPVSSFSIFRREYGYSINGGQYTYLTGGTFGYNGEQDAKEIRILKDDYITVEYRKALSTNLLSEGQKYQITGQSYTLYDHNDLTSTFGQPMQNSRAGDCVLDAEFYQGKPINFVAPEISSLEGREIKSDYSNLNKPKGSFTYVKSIEPVSKINLFLETVNGVPAYCMRGSPARRFKLLQINMEGFTYNIANYDKSGFIDTVTCCNGEEIPGAVCQNHQWIKQTQAQCDLSRGIFCPQSTFQPYGDIQYKRLYCVNNQCVPEIINVKCNDNSDCGIGLVCVTQSDPTNNYCAESGKGVGITPPPTQKSICTSCMNWLWNKLTGDKYCTPQPAKKVLGFIPIPLTSQNTVCPFFILIMLLLIAGAGYLGYAWWQKKK